MILPNIQAITLPIGPIVVPFGDYLIGFYKYEPRKGTTMGPMGKQQPNTVFLESKMPRNTERQT